jgi:hypothetical protein
VELGDEDDAINKGVIQETGMNELYRFSAKTKLQQPSLM